MEEDAKCQPVASTHAHSLTCVHIHRTHKMCVSSQKSLILLNGISISNMASVVLCVSYIGPLETKSTQKED